VKEQSRPEPPSKSFKDARTDEDCGCTALQTHCCAAEIARYGGQLLVRPQCVERYSDRAAAATPTVSQSDQQTCRPGGYRQGASLVGAAGPAGLFGRSIACIYKGRQTSVSTSRSLPLCIPPGNYRPLTVQHWLEERGRAIPTHLLHRQQVCRCVICMVDR
jgi:hypothetical protein